MTSYTIDPAHSVADFKVRHMMITNVRGEFSGVSGTVVVDHENPANSKIDAKIDVNTIQTRDAQRDTHLKSADFFDVEKFPTITFISKKVSKNGADDYAVTGDLTIHGVTKEVVLDVEEVTPEVKDPWGNVKAGAAAKTKINRKDFGLVWNATLETGGVLVGEDVQIHLDLQLLKQ
jgi:polyisoprenoid-binding protein YceI